MKKCIKQKIDEREKSEIQPGVHKGSEDAFNAVYFHVRGSGRAHLQNGTFLEHQSILE